MCDGSRSVPSPPTLCGTQGSPHLGAGGRKAHFLSCATCCGSWWRVPLARPLNYTWLPWPGRQGRGWRAEPWPEPPEEGRAVACSRPLVCLATCCSWSLLFQGFFCKTEDDFDDWCQQVRQVGGRSPCAGRAGGRLSRGLQFGVPPPSAPGAGLAVQLVASTSLCVEDVGTDLAREPWWGGLRFVSAVATRGGSKWSSPPGLWFAALRGSDRRDLMVADSAEGREPFLWRLPPRPHPRSPLLAVLISGRGREAVPPLLCLTAVSADSCRCSEVPCPCSSWWSSSLPTWPALTS